MQTSHVITAIVAAAIAAALAIVLSKLLDRLRKKDAESQAKDIIDQTNREMANREKEFELELKEKAISQKAEADNENSKARQELHEKERQLDKQEDALTQQEDQLSKQQKMVENNQRRLAERIEDASRRNEELDKLVDLQRQTLHELSGLSHDEASRRLLEMLDRELQDETGALIAKHEKRIEEECEERSRELLITATQRYAAAHTAGNTTSVRTVELTIPPTIGAATRFITSAPVPCPHNMGISPAMIAVTVMAFGRSRSQAPAITEAETAAWSRRSPRPNRS